MIPFAETHVRRGISGAVLLTTALAALLAATLPAAAHLSLVPSVMPGVLRLDFAVTPPALPFLYLIALVVPAVAVWGLARGAAGDGLRLAAFVAAIGAVLLAQSVTAFFLAWESMSLISAFLVGTHHERRDVQRALLSYVLVSQLGASCIIAALTLLGAHAGSFRFDVIAHAAAGLPDGLRFAVAALALVGFGSKAGLVPLHFWLPRAHPVAPANASAVLSGVMLNVAVYGLLLVGFRLAAPLPLGWAAAVVVVGVLTALTGALYAAVDSDLKRLLAYSSIENLGIITAVLGLALVATALHDAVTAQFALVALYVACLSHGAFKTLLFLAAGTIAEAARTTDLEHLGGLRRVLPYTAPLLLIACASAAALPPLTGFAAEWLVFAGFIRLLATAQGSIAALLAVAVAGLAAASGLAALAFVKLYGIAILGEARTVRDIARERPDAAVAALAWLGAICAAFGLAPALLTARLAPIAGTLSGTLQFDPGPLPLLPIALAALPLLGAAGAFTVARRRGVRRVATWTCGSAVTPRSQYTATAFSKPARRIFGFVLFPDHQQTTDAGTSRWFPVRIRYAFTTRDVFDEAARFTAAAIQRFARRSRIVQAGLLRVYLVYAVVAVLIVLAVAR